MKGRGSDTRFKKKTDIKGEDEAEAGERENLNIYDTTEIDEIKLQMSQTASQMLSTLDLKHKMLKEKSFDPCYTAKCLGLYNKILENTQGLEINETSDKQQFFI